MIRNYILVGLTSGITLLFLIQLINLQLISSDYQTLSLNNAVEERPIYPERGLIYDRNGLLMVANQPAYDLMVIPENLNAFDTLEIETILNISKSELNSILKKAFTYSRKLPSVVARQISKEQNAILQEKMWKYPGFYLQKKTVRDYKIPIAANVVGYSSEVNSFEIQSNPYYNLGELIGRQGIEKTYENVLRGVKGKQLFQKDRFNRILGPYKNGQFDAPPIAAQDLVLSINAELQAYGESLFINKRGGVVAIEPKTGEVLALITAPSYDPNILIGRQRSEQFNRLMGDTLSKPLYDRGLQAEYAPGSPFKILNALIGLQEGVIDENTRFVCNGGHFYARGAFMKCHCAEGTYNALMSGIYRSCNTYFAKTYKAIISNGENPEQGLDRWKAYLAEFGLGNYLGYDLPIGRPGFIPDSKYYNRWYPPGSWNANTIISNSIGQGEVLTTPIQMANFTAAIANRGYYIKPHFVRPNNPQEMDSLYQKNKINILPEHFDTVIEGMHQVVENGTARIARIKNIEVCGKTGTVENFIRLNGQKQQLTDHSMFIAFAPKEDPQIALAVFVENGYWGSRWAAPIASLMIEKYLTGAVERKWLETRMLEGSLLNEYEKPLLGKPFSINE